MKLHESCLDGGCMKARYCLAYGKPVSTCPQRKDLKQLERQQRGEAFQEEIRRSWRLVPKCWRMRVADGRGGTRPADEVILLQDVNILAEHKRTEKDRFELSFMRTNQIQGLLDFDYVLPQNIGLVFVSFNNEAIGYDDAVAFRLWDGMQFMKRIGRQYITRKELQYNTSIGGLWLPRKQLEDGPGYDLTGVNEHCFKYL